MKVITRCVNIENKEFVLILDEHDGRKYFGTIPYTELDEKGKMKRTLNGFEMAISFNSIADAIERRTRSIKIEKLINQYMQDGLTREQAAIKAIMNAKL